MKRLRRLTANAIDLFLLGAAWTPVLWVAASVMAANYQHSLAFARLSTGEQALLVAALVFALLGTMRLAFGMRWPAE